MAKRKRHNPEKRAWRGRSHKAGGRRIRDLRDLPKKDEKKDESK